MNRKNRKQALKNIKKEADAKVYDMADHFIMKQLLSDPSLADMAPEDFANELFYKILENVGQQYQQKANNLADEIEAKYSGGSDTSEEVFQKAASKKSKL